MSFLNEVCTKMKHPDQIIIFKLELLFPKSKSPQNNMKSYKLCVFYPFRDITNFVHYIETYEASLSGLLEMCKL